eukprot:scaffold10269_cov102-Isochrysis_galbana.AAC.9
MGSRCLWDQGTAALSLAEESALSWLRGQTQRPRWACLAGGSPPSFGGWLARQPRGGVGRRFVVYCPPSGCKSPP